MDSSERFRAVIEAGRQMVFFGGAGVSTESGIPDFRSADGLYAQKFSHPPEEILSHDFFMAHPDEFFRFYREKMIFPAARPNTAHLALAELERRGKLTAVVTQNIDGLHSAAGSKRVFELHGSILRNHCTRCGRAYTLEETLHAGEIPRCSCGGIIKPDVVLYGESLPDDAVAGAVDAISKADVLIVGGTSLSVWPAAGLLRYFQGNELVLINRTPTAADSSATLLLREPIGAVFASLSLC